MKIDLSQFRQTFLLESADHIASMETKLLELRSAPDSTELHNSIFRSAHSIKGGAGSFGLKSLVRFTHALENLLDRIRSGEIRVSDEGIDILLQSSDVLRALLDADANAELPPEAAALQQRIEALMQDGAGGDEHIATSDSPAVAPDQGPTKQYKVQFRPDRQLFTSGTNPIVLLRNLAALGTARDCHLHADELPALSDLDPALCYLRWTVTLESTASETELREVFEFVEDLSEVVITCHEMPLDDTLTSQVPSLAQTKRAKTQPATVKPAASGEASSIRVPIDKVDRLIDLVGELVIAHVMTAKMVQDFEPSCLPKLREAVESMERNTRELHERVMGIRMLPVASLFHRYPRTVYDIAQATGKQIRLEMHGEQAEIDKSMLEMLGDPLTHLVRNAADHGIELPDARRAAGKAEEGVVILRAFHRSGRIVIEVSDDGAGIDADKVRSKAIERGLISADAQLSVEQLRMLIFEPGFSTREEVSDLSGRGVGMDVVKRNVQQLNGTVALVSEKGQGSTVIIELPLTLAILEGLLVRVEDRTLVLPLLSVIETVPLPDEKIIRLAQKGEVVVIRDESVPLLRLSRFLGVCQQRLDTTESSHRSLAVIVESGGRKVGLVVDELLGQQQVVVKSLERHLRKIEGLMGATILADGRVAPIVDVASMGELDLFSLQASRAWLTPAALSAAAETSLHLVNGKRGATHASI